MLNRTLATGRKLQIIKVLSYELKYDSHGVYDGHVLPYRAHGLQHADLTDIYVSMCGESVDSFLHFFP